VINARYGPNHGRSGHASLMTLASQVDYLLDYTEWDRAHWEEWFRAQAPAALAVSMGPNADGRISNVGELVRHIFSAEQRYVDRIQEQPITDTGTVSAADVDARLDFGRHTRHNLRQLLHEFPAERWNVSREIQMGQAKRTVTPRTMLVQAVTHEIRHWAQVATLLRMEGLKTGPHDFLVSGVFERRQ
jgi:uncharacterized damage-inducible protein DinB